MRILPCQSNPRNNDRESRIASSSPTADASRKSPSYRKFGRKEDTSLASSHRQRHHQPRHMDWLSLRPPNFVSSLLVLHSYHIPSLLEESHEGRLQHHVLLLAISRGVEELQEILLVYRTEDVIQIFRMIRRFVEHHLVVVLQQVAQGGEAHGTQHPLRHIVTLHGVFLQIIAIAIRLATAFHTDAQL